MLIELKGGRPILDPGAFVAPTAVVAGQVHLQEGCSVWFGAVIRGDNDLIRLGPCTNVQDGCILHTDAGLPMQVGAECVLGHAAILHGCTVGDRVLVGIGARVLNGAVLEPEVVVAAGALVPEGARLESGYLYLGVPARRHRRVTEEERERRAQGVRHYLEKADLYRQALRGPRLVEIARFTPDVEGAVAFYARLLDRPPRRSSPGMAEFDLGAVVLRLHATYQAGPGELPPRDHIALAVPDLDQALRRLEEQGLLPEHPARTYPWGRSAYFSDPDGRQVELQEDA
jgi:carbonic anhydrase/acetyltransferase-like protein (isoleucine patch superfamily)/predicted enzyme related to lactoylglutathione lyase